MPEAVSTKGEAPTAPTVEASSEKTSSSKKDSLMIDSNTPAFILDDVHVRQVDGLYSLNDMHIASGSASKHRPGYFTINEQTKGLIAEIEKAGNPAIVSKPKVGTFACRELVIAYAAWISSSFHLKVIRSFLASVPTQARNALAYERISPSQAQDLKEIVQTVVASGVQGFGETYARLHRKFRVNSYLELPASKHWEAREYLLAKIPPDFTPVTPIPNREPAIDITDRSGMQHARQAALKYFDDFRNVVSAGGKGVDFEQIPDEVLVGLIESSLQNKKFIIGITGPHLSLTPLNPKAILASPLKLAEGIKNGDIGMDNHELTQILVAVSSKLAGRVEHLEARLTKPRLEPELRQRIA